MNESGTRLHLIKGIFEASREVRPDWDITAPELRAAWDAGDKSRFYPYSSKQS